MSLFLVLCCFPDKIFGEIINAVMTSHFSVFLQYFGFHTYVLPSTLSSLDIVVINLNLSHLIV